MIGSPNGEGVQYRLIDQRRPRPCPVAITRRVSDNDRLFLLAALRSAFYLPGTRHESRFREPYAAILQPINNRRVHLTLVVIPAMLLTLNRSSYILAYVPAKIVFITSVS